MEAPGKGILKVVSILFIIFGAIATVISLVVLLGSAALFAPYSGFIGAVGGILMAAAVLGLIVNVLELIVGIAGLKRSGDPRKSGYFITTGIIISALALISMIIGISGGNIGWTNLVNFVLAILYIVGGAMNRRTALE